MPFKTVKKDAADALTIEWDLHVKNYKLTLDKKRCVSCQVCTLACPKEAVTTQKQPRPRLTSTWQNVIFAESATSHARTGQSELL